MRAYRLLPVVLLVLAGCRDQTPTSPEVEAAVAGLFRETLPLDVGEALTLSAAEAHTLVLPGGTSGAEYVYIPFNASQQATARLAVEIRGANLLPTAGDAEAARIPLDARLGAAIARPALPAADEEFHLRLRHRELQELRPRAGVSGTPRLARTPSPLRIDENPSVGDTLVINVNADVPCANPTLAQARVVAVSTHAIVAADLANPSGGFSQEEFESVAAAFDTLIYPVSVQNFGEPVYGSFVAPGDRVILLYTRAVNELTEPGSDSFVGGFFFGRDLFPRVAQEELGGCLGSNEAPIMYLLAPDPSGELGPPRSRQFIFESTLSTVAHELQHLINQARRLFVTPGAEPFEEVWLNEGLSHIAEELMFYNSTELGPRLNIDLRTLASSEHNIEMFFTYQVSNFGRYIQYLQNPDTTSLLGVDELPTRGASWAFLRYVADHDAGSDAALFRRLVDGPQTGVQNLAAAVEGDPIDLMQAWTASVYADDVLPGVEFAALYQQPSWNFRSVISGFRNSQGQRAYPEFPLKVRTLTPEEQTVELKGGGAAFFRFGVAAGGRATIVTTSGGTVPGDRLRLTVLRVR